jgi:hypothetical protein
MIDAVAVMLENFYKPELDAAHNHSAPPGQALGLRCYHTRKPGKTDNWDFLA